MAKLARRNGITSMILRVKILNSTLTTGAGLTGLTSASSGLIISTIADNEAAATVYTVAGGTIETITTLGTFAAPTATKCRFKEVDATNHPGLYEIQIANARYAVANAKSLIVSVLGATNAAQVDSEIDLGAQLGVDGINRAVFNADTGLQSIRSGTAQAGGASTITLDAGASAVDDFAAYVGSTIFLVSGTGVEQYATILSYVGSSKVATVDVPWDTVPDSTTGFAIFPAAASPAEIAAAVWADASATALAAALAVVDSLVDAVKAKTDNLPSDPADQSLIIAATNAITAAIAALNNISAAQVNAEILDVLTTDTFGEPTGVPAATATLANKLAYLFMALRNAITVNRTTGKKQFFDDGGAAEWEKDVADDGTTYSESEGNAP